MFLYINNMTSSQNVVTEDGDRQNIYATEPQMRVMDAEDQLKRAEILNGRLAMIGFNAALGAYIFTGQIIPGVF